MDDRVFNHMASGEGKEIILNGWKPAGITEALEKGLENLPALDPFNNIDPMVNLTKEEPNMDVFLNTAHEDLVILGFKKNSFQDFLPTMKEKLLLTSAKIGYHFEFFFGQTNDNKLVSMFPKFEGKLLWLGF